MDFRLLGPLEVVTGDGAVSLGPPKQRALLALLLLCANEIVPREVAIDALWNEQPPDRAANAVQVYVHGLRKVLGQERIALRGNGYVIEVDREDVDLLRFERLLARGEAALGGQHAADAVPLFAEALALWRGEPLADLPFEALTAERARLEELRLRAHELSVDAQLAVGRHDDVIPELEALVARNPFRERLRAQHMLALYRAGRQAEALDAFQAARRALADELALEPSAGLRELERAILRQDPSLRLVGRRAQLRLPEPRTPTVGRALDVVAVTARMRDSEMRLLTLTGPGGVGKTRLAIEAAAELGRELTDGAFFVDLAPLADPAQVAATIAAAVGVPAEDRRSATDALVALLRGREAVLVLDNFERLVDAADVVGVILDGAPRVRIIVTSRTPLRLAAEQEYAVQPLQTPHVDASLGSLVRNDSVSVFVARAQAVDRDFRLDDENAGDVATICRALEGLPLALELAAARVKVLTPAQIRERLDHPLDVLAGGSRDLPERQQTLRATIAWSHELLDERARRLFAELSVFAGGCTLEAAEAVCDADLEALGALLDNGLLRRVQPESGRPRFQMLDAVREFAAERLADPERVRMRHAVHYASFAERVGSSLVAPAMSVELAPERANLRAALAHALRHERELGFRIVAPLRRYWSSAREGDVAEWLQAAFGQEPSATTSAQVGALVVLGRHAMIAGRYDESRRAFEEVLRAARPLESWSDAAAAASYLAWLAAASGDYAAERQYGEESIELARRAKDLWSERQGLAMVAGALINDGDPAAARPHLERSLELARRLDDPATTVIALVNSGYGAICAGDLSRARGELEHAEQVARDLDQPAAIVSALQPLAWQANAVGEPERARMLLAEALALLEREGHHSHRVDVLAEAAITLADDDPATAATVLGAADAGAAAAGIRLSPPLTQRADDLRRQLSERLGDEFQAFLDQGLALDLAQAVRDAHTALMSRAGART